MGVAVFQQNILMMLNSEFHLIFTCPKVIGFLIFFLIIQNFKNHPYLSSCTETGWRPDLATEKTAQPVHWGRVCIKPISQSAPRLSPSSPTPPLQPSPTFVSRQTLHLVPTRVFTVPRFEGIHSAEGERGVILFIRGLQIHVLFTWDEWVGLVDLHW